MKANLLLVDDRRENLLALRAILEPLDCSFVEATSGTAALSHLLRTEFALILMDVQMPGLDGFETASLIKERERTRHIPIVFVTAISKEQSYIFKGYSAGAVDYISKPFDPDILRSKVAVFIELWQKTEQIKLQAEALRQNEQLEREREMARLELELERRHLAQIAQSRLDLERFKETLDATLDGVSIFDANTLEFSYVNQGALGLLGYGHDEMLRLRAFAIELLPDEERFRRLLAPLIRGEKQSLTLQTQHKRKDGTLFPVEVFLQHVAPPLSAPTGETGGFISIARDISERKRAEEQLIAAKENAEREHQKAERANQAKSDFIAGVSHELRTPLNAILGFSKLLLNPRVGPLNEDQSAYAGDVVKSAEHLLQLINDILDISKIEAGKMALDPAPFSLGEVLQNSLSVVRERAAEHNLELTVELSPDILALDPVLGDERKVKQVLYNLLSNAAKFTPDGGSILLSAHCDHSEANLPQVMIQVRDTGVGISPEHQERIWNAFEQVDGSYTRKQQGTGLGLALTRRIVELHGGRIWLESAEGEGSTFFVSLPLHFQPKGDEMPDLISGAPDGAIEENGGAVEENGAGTSVALAHPKRARRKDAK